MKMHGRMENDSLTRIQDLGRLTSCSLPVLMAAASRLELESESRSQMPKNQKSQKNNRRKHFTLSIKIPLKRECRDKDEAENTNIVEERPPS